MKIISVKVKPNSQQQRVTQADGGSFTIHLKSPPVDGKANAERIQLLAKTFAVPKSAIRIKTGAGSKSKSVEIDEE